MLRIMVVDGVCERRAEIIDALCEVPGLEVCASASDTSKAITRLDLTRFDIVVAASDLPSSSIFTLIESARRRGVPHIVVLVARQPLLPEVIDYWHDRGAREVASTLPDLVECCTALAERRRHHPPHRPAASARTDAPAATSGSLAAHPSITPSGVIVGSGAVVHATPQVIRVADALREAIPRWRRMISPDVEIQVNASDDVPPVRCLPRDLELLALYLVLDATRALPLGGSVWLCVEREGSQHIRIEVYDSSGRPRQSWSGADMIRTIARRYAGDVRTIDLGGGAVSLEVTLPAVVSPSS